MSRYRGFGTPQTFVYSHQTASWILRKPNEESITQEEGFTDGKESSYIEAQRDPPQYLNKLLPLPEVPEYNLTTLLTKYSIAL